MEWKAELTFVVGYVPEWFTCPQTVTHPSLTIETRLKFVYNTHVPGTLQVVVWLSW